MSTPLDDWLHTVHPDVRKYLKVSHTQDTGRCLHIDLNPIKAFTPMISHRQNPKEDRTVPRVCIANSLMGCIGGYASVFYNYLNHKPGTKLGTKAESYRGGMFIHAIDTEWVVEADNKLVGDSRITGEKWLVGWDEEHLSYPATEIGKFFIKRMVSETIRGGDLAANFTMYLEYHDDSQALELGNGVSVEAGYYELQVLVKADLESVHTGYFFLSEKNSPVKVKSISKEEYLKEKSAGLDLLNEKYNLHW